MSVLFAYSFRPYNSLRSKRFQSSCSAKVTYFFTYFFLLSEEKASNYFNRSKTLLEHRPRILLPWKCQFRTKHRVMASRRRKCNQKNLNLALLWNRSTSKWVTPRASLKFPRRRGTVKINPYKTHFQGYPRNALAHFTKKWRKKHECCILDIFKSSKTQFFYFFFLNSFW